MQSTLPHRALQAHRLAPFVLLSLLLHGALLFVVRPLTKNTPIAEPHPLEVYFSALAVSGSTPIADTAPAGESRNRATRTHASPLAAQSNATAPSGSPGTFTQDAFNPQQLIESAKSIARDEARNTERQIAAQEKKKLDTPLGSLEQYLRQPHKELRLANGMLKIITDAGEVCFQPVPHFARDMSGLYGIPTTCP